MLHPTDVLFQVDLAIRSAQRVRAVAADWAAWAERWLADTDRDGLAAREAKRQAEACARALEGPTVWAPVKDDALYHGHQAQAEAAEAAWFLARGLYSLAQASAVSATWCAGRSLHGAERFTPRRFSDEKYAPPALVFPDYSTDYRVRTGRNYDPDEV